MLKRNAWRAILQKSVIRQRKVAEGSKRAKMGVGLGGRKGE